MTSDFNLLEMIIQSLCDKTTNDKFEAILSIEDLNKMSNKVYSHLKNKRNIRNLVELPSRYIITKNDYVIDLVDNEVMTIEEIRLKYDIINKANVNYVDYQSLDQHDKERSDLNRQIISRIMSDWSSQKEDVEYLLWQLTYAVLQNDNHGKFFIIKGPAVMVNQHIWNCWRR